VAAFPQRASVGSSGSGDRTLDAFVEQGRTAKPLAGAEDLLAGDLPLPIWGARSPTMFRGC
jgi:hypothetical protein